VLSPSIFWPSFAGAATLAIGLFAARKPLLAAHGTNKLIALGCVFFAAPLAAFGAEHLVDARGIMSVVPTWMPLRLFWTYLVGVALIAAGMSLAFRKYLRLSSTLLAIMFFLFVLLIHIPNVATQLHDRFVWAVAFRDLSFAAGALALSASSNPSASSNFSEPQNPDRRTNILIRIAGISIGVALIVYGVEHFLHPEFAPGVPLSKLTPPWVPLPTAWAYLTGAILLLSGAAILLNKYARIAATTVGALMVLLTLFLYTPILAMATGDSQLIVGVNYVFDTLLYGGALLLLAEALPATAARSLPAHS
jgi:uncharacterized membrane protein